MTRLVERPDVVEALTVRRETDVRTALTRGLAEYLATLSITWNGGREVRFRDAKQTWSEPEEPGLYPSAVVYASGDGEYEAERFTPQTIMLDGEARLALRKVCEYAVDLTVEIYSNDPQERMALAAMVEDALDPHDWRTGLLLELPHYFGARATYEKMSNSYLDDADVAQRRKRLATFEVRAVVSQYRVIGRPPLLDVRREVEVLEPGASN